MFRATLRLLVLAVVLLVPSVNAAADPIFIDFETFGSGDELTNQIPGVTFSNAAVLTAGISLNEFDFPPASGVNVAFDNGGPLRIDFLSPIESFAAHFTYALQLQLQVYDAASNLLGVVTSAFASNIAFGGDPGSTPNELLAASFGGMAYLTITGDELGGSFAMDDVVITPVESKVPEPATFGLVLLGMSTIVARSLRHRRSRH